MSNQLRYSMYSTEQLYNRINELTIEYGGPALMPVNVRNEIQSITGEILRRARNRISSQNIQNTDKPPPKREPPPSSGGRTIQAAGIVKRDVGRLPPQVRNLLEKVKDEKITSIQVWRYPLLEPLQNILKKIVKLPYDSIFHSGVNLNGKYNLEKDNLLKFTKGKQRGDTPKNASKVYKVEKDITFGELFDGLRKTMGDAGLTEYDARTNNCQDFSLAILKVLGVSNNELKTFIKQDADKIFKSTGFFEKVVEAGTKLNTLKEQVIDRLTQGEGTGVQEGGACSCHQEGMGADYIHNYALPRCKIQY